MEVPPSPVVRRADASSDVSVDGSSPDASVVDAARADASEAAVADSAVDAPEVPPVEVCNGLDDDGDGTFDEGSCPESYACANAARCTCATWWTRCANACIDTATSAANCGACGNACAAGRLCVAGECATQCGESATIQRCGSQCVNVQTNPLHCGGCGLRCDAPLRCVAGACVATPVVPFEGARVGARTPTFRWSAGAGTVEVCAERACTRVVASVTGDGRAQLGTSLAPGVWYWRVRTAAGSASRVVGFRVDARTAPRNGLLAPGTDLNGDGLDDLLVTEGTRSVLLFPGARGRLAALPTRRFTLGAETVDDVSLRAMGDPDRNGVCDVSVLRGASARLWGGIGDARVTLEGVTPTRRDLPVFDFDLDGASDWLVLDGTSPTIQFTRDVMPVDAPFTRAGYTGRSETLAVVGDVNGDDALDVALGAPDVFPPRVYVLLAGSATTARSVTLPLPPRTTGFGASVAPAGDLNGDGYADLLVALRPWGSAVYLGGPDTLTLLRVLRAPDDGDLLASAAGDVDGDGFYDLAVLPRGTDAVLLYRGAPGGLVDAPYPVEGIGWRYVESLTAAGDLDGDGYDDLAATAPSQGIVYAVYGHRSTPWTRADTLRGDAAAEFGRLAL